MTTIAIVLAILLAWFCACYKLWTDWVDAAIGGVIGVMLIGWLIFGGVGFAHAQEMFLPFDGSEVEQRHRIEGVTVVANSSLYWGAGMKPEYAVPLGIGTTLLAEHVQHKGAHGITKGEFTNVAIWGAGTYVVIKALDKYGFPSPFYWEW